MDIKHEILLVNFIEKSLGRPFAWGESDCNIFALETMDAVFGTVLADEIKGRYYTELGAFNFRRRSRWGSFINLLEESGFTKIPKGFEQVGDLLIVEDPRWEMVHVCLGIDAVSSLPGEGIRHFPVSMLKDKPYSVWRFACPVQFRQ